LLSGDSPLLWETQIMTRVAGDAGLALGSFA
jgi:hypothetical protein